jgi:hypothetical protein
MEKNPQDQNLADAPDDQNKTFNPNNVYSEPTNKKPTGPLGSEEAKLKEPLGETKIISTDKEERSKTDSPDEINKPANNREF